MSASSDTPVEPAVPDAAGVATPNEVADDGPPEAAQSGSSDDAADDALPKPKYLDPNWIKEGVPETQFYKDYPPDQWGQEAAPNARVWKIYRDEMTSADADTLKSWNDTIDVLLIFAGLFSAVSTAFIVESYKNLQPDYTQYIANALYTTATSNPSSGSGINILNIGSMGPPNRYVHPSTTQRWTNGLWFTSLVVSLTVALLCILIKQWLDQYRARTTRAASSLQAWARRHQIYYRGLSRWGIPSLISLLPLLLHISLFLFFSGLVLFLQPLDSAIAFPLLAILILTLLFYLLSLVIPAFFIDCPSYTLLLAQAQSLISFGLRLLARLSSLLASQYPRRGWSTNGSIVAHIRHTIFHANKALTDLLIRSKQRFARETTAIEAQKFVLDGWALNTLLVSTNDPDVLDAIVEAIGAVTAEHTLEVVVREGPLGVIDERSCRDFLATGDAPSPFSALTYARRMRTYCTLSTTRSPTSLPSMRADLHPFLGLDGVMLHSMVQIVVFRIMLESTQLYDRLLSHATHLTEALPVAGDRSPVPHRQSPLGVDRATCQLFLRLMQIVHLHFRQHDFPCALLAFCAGDFAKAGSHERASAIQNLLAFLQRACGAVAATRNAPAGNANDTARVSLDRLFGLLATRQKLLSDEAVARPFIHHLGLVSLSLYSGTSPQWEQLAGFAAFMQSSNFIQDISREGLDAFIDVLGCVSTPDNKKTELSQRYWTCVATLLKLQCDFGQELVRSLCSKIEMFLAYPGSVITVFGRASDTVLSQFLRVVGTIDARVEPTSEWLSCLLCYRLRTQPISHELVQFLLTGTFLAKQFREHLSVIHWRGREYARLRIMTLAKHCARVSDPYINRVSSGSTSATHTSPCALDAILRICDELEHDARSLTNDVLALLQDVRGGLARGEELRGECDPSCDCWYEPAVRPAAQPTMPTKWWETNILGRIRGGTVLAV